MPMPDPEVELQEIMRTCSGNFFTLRANSDQMLEQSIRRLAAIVWFQERRIKHLAETAGIEFPPSLLLSDATSIVAQVSPETDTDSEAAGEPGEPVASSELTREPSRRRRLRQQ
jgi:hypothetical protein